MGECGGMAKQDRPEPWAQYMRDLGDNLARWRGKRRLSQEKVAFASHLSRYTYQQLEKGKGKANESANPTMFTLVSIAETLAVPLSEIIPEPSGTVTLRPEDPDGRKRYDPNEG